MDIPSQMNTTIKHLDKTRHKDNCLQQSETHVTAEAYITLYTAYKVYDPQLIGDSSLIQKY